MSETATTKVIQYGEARKDSPDSTLAKISRFQPKEEEWKLNDMGRVEAVKRKLASIFGRERSEKLPKVVFDIYFGTHEDAADAQKMEEGFKNCDVYIPEWAGWTADIKDTVNLVSKGQLTPREGERKFGASSYQEQMLQMLYKSNKPVRFIDYRPDEFGLRREVEAVRDVLSLGRYWRYGRTFADKIQTVKRRLQEVAESTLERENKTLSRIKPALTEVVENNPDLRKKAIKKGELRVFLSYGSFHTRISHALAKEGEDVTRLFPEKPYVYNLILEGERRYYFGKEVDDTLAAQILLECMVDGTFRPLFKSKLPNSEAILRFERDLASKFSYEDIEKIVDSCPADGRFYEARDVLLEKIREKTDSLDTLWTSRG